MSKFQILLFGLIGSYVLLLEAFWEPFVPAALAITVTVLITIGFLFRPDRDHWIVWISEYRAVGADDEEFTDFLLVTDAVKMRVTVCRLWLLFVPTALGIGSLVWMYARGIWKIDLIDYGHYGLAFGGFIGYFAFFIWFLVSSWVSERWLLRRAAAIQAEGLSRSYYFVVSGEYYGGSLIRLGKFKPWEWSPNTDEVLSSVVMFRRDNPSANRLAISFFFHRFEIDARGVEDLKDARVLGERLQAQNWAAQENS